MALPHPFPDSPFSSPEGWYAVTTAVANDALREAPTSELNPFQHALAALDSLSQAHQGARVSVSEFKRRNLKVFLPLSNRLSALTTSLFPVDLTDADDIAEYWTSTAGPNWNLVVASGEQSDFIKATPDFDPISLFLDSRIPCLGPDEERLTPEFFDHWFASASLMTSISVRAHHIQHLHIRMPSNSNSFRVLEDILAENHALRHVVIDADPIIGMPRADRPVFDLGRACHHGDTYAPLDTFILRAPDATINIEASCHLLARLSNATQVGFSQDTLSHSIFTWEWLRELLLAIPRVRQFAFSVVQDTSDGFCPMTEACDIPLLALTDFTLSINVIDRHLLTALIAPKLRGLKLWSSNYLDRHGSCPDNHFPSLFYVISTGPGTISRTCDSLGIARHKYFHNISHVYPDDTEQEVIAYIKPYRRPELVEPESVKRVALAGCEDLPCRKRTRIE